MVTVKLLNGHVLDHLRELPDDSVHCVVTSPPYWGLRDYGIEPVVWGGEASCRHDFSENIPPRGKSGWHTFEKKYHSPGCHQTTIGSKAKKEPEINPGHGQYCHLCSAWRGSYGLEPTIELYVRHTVEIFREVRRVLRKDGVCFLNLGDSYHGGKGRSNYAFQTKRLSETINKPHSAIMSMYGDTRPADMPQDGLKPKDLCGVPWRIALALQADGWWLRSDIIWAKSNPMPESVTDRPTRSHEYIFLLTKSAKYFWDQGAVREDATKTGTPGHLKSGNGHRHENHQAFAGKSWEQSAGRNLRSVWNIATEPFPEAHFATFPQKLVETCIKAGTSDKGVCPKCGAPWVRMLEKKYEKVGSGTVGGRGRFSEKDNSGFTGKPNMRRCDNTLGWQPSCKCASWDESIPATVLDPFAGSGTVGLVAAKLQRNSILIEMKSEYCNMARKRIKKEMGFLAEVE